MLYRALIRPLLYLLPAEAAHSFGFACLRLLLQIPGLRALLRLVSLPDSPSLKVRALGLEFPTPIGLAAGFDKEAIGFEALGALGFGFVEVGTLTSCPQPGNSKPRLFRLPRDRALVNRMGFNNSGAEDAAGWRWAVAPWLASTSARASEYRNRRRLPTTLGRQPWSPPTPTT